MNKRVFGLFLLCVFVLSLNTAPPSGDEIVFRVRLDQAAAKDPVSGRLKVCLSANPLEKPLDHLEQNAYDPEPFYYRDVENWRPGETITVDKKAKSFFYRLEDLPRRRYAFQAILETKDPDRDYTDKSGFLWGPVVIEKLAPGQAHTISLVLKSVVPPFRFPETETAREVVVASRLLSRFYGHPVDMRAGVILPESYGKEPGRKYPAVYVIHGLFGSYRQVAMNQRRYGMNQVGRDKIYVLLDGNGTLGHHSFCDSENNGPRASALVEEFIPAIEKRFRVIPESESRFLMGQSSGGWSALWLQVNYPEYFGGVWAASPDPVDFRCFSYAGDLYEPGANLYYDRDGKERPFWMFGGYPICTTKEFFELEDASGTANQFQSWEAAWSPRGKDGRPQPFFDRTAGAIDPKITAWWKRYDISLLLKTKWPAIEPHLRGKIHVYAGDHDDFALDKTVLSLKNVLGALNAEVAVEVLPGNHILWNQEFTARVQKEMDAMLPALDPKGKRNTRTP